MSAAPSIKSSPGGFDAFHGNSHLTGLMSFCGYAFREAQLTAYTKEVYENYAVPR